MVNIVFKTESPEPERTPSPEVLEVEFEPATLEKIVLKELILMYEALPELWDKSSQHYQSSIRRGIAWIKLLRIYEKIKSDATIGDVKKIINSIRSNFKREWNKLEASKRSRGRTGGGDVYTPRSWAFHLLTFLKRKGQPICQRTSTASEDLKSEGQKRDAVGKPSLPPGPKRWKQSISEQNELENQSCSSFSPHLLNAPLDQQHSFLPQSANAPLDQTPSLLPQSANAPLDQTPSFLPQSANAQLDQTPSCLPQSVNAPLDQPHSFITQPVNAPSPVHTLSPTALYWSHKLGNLNRTQRLYAEKYINEILLEAEFGNLGRNSVIIHSSDQIETPKPAGVYSVCHPTPSSSDK